MKRILAVLVALVMVLAISAPALANEVNVGTGVTVTQGGGNRPVIKAKWETPDDLAAPFTQVMPPCSWGGEVAVTVYVVVADIEDQGDVAQAVGDVFHPLGPPLDGSIKYDNISFIKLPTSAGITAANYANSHGLVHYNTGFDFDDVMFELTESGAEVWSATFILHYCQPAGDYTVTVVAVDTHGNTSVPFTNTFNYIPTCCIATDFSSITYPSVMISSQVLVLGDGIFNPGDGRPTVSNIGNTDVVINIEQDDMSFGQYANGDWKVQFDARLGPEVPPDDATRVLFNPDELVTLPGIVPLCGYMKMDFSIHILFALPGSYSGTMCIGCEISPWGNPD